MSAHKLDEDLLIPDDATTSSTSFTPVSFTPTTSRFPNLHIDDDGTVWGDRPSAIPWAHSIYMILETTTKKCITIENKKIVLRDFSSAELPKANNSWLCLEKDGYLGFQNPATGRFLGRNGHRKIHADASHFKGYEMFAPRKHTNGAYMMMMAADNFKLRMMCLDENGEELVDRDHGCTTWEFYKV